MAHVYKWIRSPIGVLQLVASDDGLAAILWADEFRSWKHLGPAPTQHPTHPILVETERQLGEYFAGTRKQFTLRLDFDGTAFQKAVWAALLTIPYGEVRSYGEIARQIGKPKAMRAVGAAAGMNPISIIAPCHRVLGADGTLTGFAGGLEAKIGLLAVENIPYRKSAKDGKAPALADLFDMGLGTAA
jgi:methylated-DNA-[protein]-cysteine S-methyltransferase